MTRILKPVCLIVVLALVLSLATIVLPSPVLAQPSQVWVDDDYCDTCLNDSHTWNVDAFDTIQAGINAVASSGTVNVAAGTYNENVHIDKPLRLLGEGRDMVEVYSSADYVFHVASDYVDISGFFISWGNWAGIRLDGVQHCNVFDNYLYQNTDGIDLIYSSNNTIRNNGIWENWWDGIYLYQSPENLIEDNIIYANYNQWSCPFVYSWDGQEYRLDSHPLGKEEKTDYDKLEYLTPADGKYLMKMTEEMYETTYVNELKLIAVDHPNGTQIVTNRKGKIYTLREPYAPKTGVEEDGTDCLDKVKDKDGIYWTSNMDNKDFSEDEDLRDGIILTFDKPAGAKKAKVVVNFKNTPLFEYMVRTMLGLPQDSPGIDELRKSIVRLQLEVWSETEMVAEETFQGTGAYVDRDDIKVINVSGITGSEITIKLNSLTGLVLIDSVMVDYSANETVYTTELPATTAVDANGIDVAPQILSDDGDYLVLEQGDCAYLSFDEPDAIPEHERSYIIKAKGYYESPMLTNLESETRRDLSEQFVADPYYAMRYSLERYRPGYCGIYLDEGSSGNTISGNEIHDNNGDGIYLYYADNNHIIDNEIYWNGYTGIWLDYSDSNRIAFNDIYENSWGGAGIYLNPDSWDNVINFNNIVDNADYGIYNDNDGDVVDATNNWWGNASGPADAVKLTATGYTAYGDSVSANVDYEPWLLEAVVSGTTPTTYDKTLALKDGWTLVSTDKEVTTGTAWIGTTVLAGTDTILAYKYTPGTGYPQVTMATQLTSVDAYYIKTSGGGGVGINYSTSAPGVVTKTLSAGWNIISCAGETDAYTLLSQLRYVQIGQQEGVGLTSLIGQGSYNQFTDDISRTLVIDAEWVGFKIINTVELNSFDGFWVYMNAGKSFGVIPD